MTVTAEITGSKHEKWAGSIVESNKTFLSNLDVYFSFPTVLSSIYSREANGSLAPGGPLSKIGDQQSDFFNFRDLAILDSPVSCCKSQK